MANLFIVGNGFDLAHGLPSGYNDFKKWLKKNYPQEYEEELSVDGINMESSTSDVAIIRAILDSTENKIQMERKETKEHTIDYDGEIKWNNLEEALGEIKVEGFIEKNNPFDYGDDSNQEFAIVAMNEENAFRLIDGFSSITEYYSEWIESISLEDVGKKEGFNKIIDINNDIFLNFNYTQTLESIYLAKEVCHIHGITGEDIIVGHGNLDNPYVVCEPSYDGDIKKLVDIDLDYIGAEVAGEYILNSLRKETSEIINKNSEFFESIKELKVNKIYSWGFSFAEVDLIYIEKICEKLAGRKDVTWLFNDYDIRDKLKNWQKKLKHYGFKGGFSTFSHN